MAAEAGLTFLPTRRGDHVSGRLAGAVNLASGRFAMIDTGSASSLCPGNRCWTGALASTSRGWRETAAASTGLSAEGAGLVLGYAEGKRRAMSLPRQTLPPCVAFGAVSGRSGF